MNNNRTPQNNKHTGIHYLTIVRQPGDEEDLSEEKIQRQVEEMSKELDGAPVMFAGYEVDNREATLYEQS